MTDEVEPNLVTSGKSKVVDIGGYRFSIQIFRLETDATWCLEVVDCKNASHVWEHQFASDEEAAETAVSTIEAEGAVAFMRGSNVIPFRRS